jgi:hypothetical protein
MDTVYEDEQKEHVIIILKGVSVHWITTCLLDGERKSRI